MRPDNDLDGDPRSPDASFGGGEGGARCRSGAEQADHDSG